jgi:hypothetical protein
MHASKTEFSEYFIYKITWLYNVDKKLGLFFKVMQLLFLQYGWTGTNVLTFRPEPARSGRNWKKFRPEIPAESRTITEVMFRSLLWFK